jgi:hypothetical protein
MFLILVLFGLLALGLAFVTYLQSDLNQSTPPKPTPPAIVAPAAPAAPFAMPEATQTPTTVSDSPPASTSPAAVVSSTTPASIPAPSQADAAEQLRAVLKEAAEALSKVSTENKEPGTSSPP